MKIALFFSDGIIGNIALNKIVPQMINDGMKPVLFKSRGPNLARAKIPELAALSYLESGLLKDVVEPTLSDTPTNDESLKVSYTTHQLAKKYDLDYYDVENVNSAEFINDVKKDKDIVGGVSIRFYPKFKKEIIQTFNAKGFLWNLHTGLLPKYKGVFIPYRALENNEKYYGWTLHEVASEIDTGDIIALDKLPLRRLRSVLDTYLDMADKGAAMTMEALHSYKQKNFVKAEPQLTDKNSYFTFPTKSEMERWNEKGIIFADDIINTYTSHYTKKRSKEEKALKRALTNAISQSAVSGTVTKAA